MEESNKAQSTKHKAQRLIMHGVNVMLAISPGVSMNVFLDPPKAASRRKEIMQEPDAPNHAGRTILVSHIRNSEPINLMWPIVWAPFV